MLVAIFSLMKLRVIAAATVFSLMIPLAPKAGTIEERIQPAQMKKAWELLKTNRTSEAVNTLVTYHPDLATDPESTALYHFIYAKAMDAERKLQPAVEHYRKAYLYSDGGELKELALLQRGEAYLRLKYFYEAKTDFALFIRMFPASKYLDTVHMGMATALAETGLLHDALDMCEKAVKTPEVDFAKANILQRLGRVREARSLYESASASAPSFVGKSEEKLHIIGEGAEKISRLRFLDREQTIYYYGENLRMTGMSVRAKTMFSSLSSPYYKGRGALGLGLIAVEESRTDEAVRHFQAALRSSERETRRKALINLADIAIQAGKTQEAGKDLEQLISDYPYTKEYDEAALRLAKIFRSSGEYDRSVRILKDLVLRRHPVKEAIDQFESILVEAKDKRDFGRLAELWKSVGPWLLDNSRESFLLDIASELNNRSRPFLEIMNWLVKHGSGNAGLKALVSLAGMHAESGSIQTAREYLNTIKKKSGLSDDVFRIEAGILLREGNYSAAAESMMSVRKIQQKDFRILGETVTAAKDRKKALAKFERALQEVGGAADDYARMADILYDQNNRQGALTYYRTVLSKAPAHEWAIYRLASLSGAEEAEAVLKKMTKGNSSVQNSAALRMKELTIDKKVTEIF